MSKFERGDTFHLGDIFISVIAVVQNAGKLVYKCFSTTFVNSDMSEEQLSKLKKV